MHLAAGLTPINSATLLFSSFTTFAASVTFRLSNLLDAMPVIDTPIKASFSVVLAAIGRLVDESRRSFALGVATAFGSVGQFVLIPVARILIDATSWETALLLLAGLTALIAVFCLRETHAKPREI